MVMDQCARLVVPIPLQSVRSMAMSAMMVECKRLYLFYPNALIHYDVELCSHIFGEHMCR